KALAKRFRDMPALMAAIEAAAASEGGKDWLELSGIPRIGPTTRDRLVESGFPSEEEAAGEGEAVRVRLTSVQRESLV
ncbi:hypothetical protein, partial [Klebsiella aerogenes]